MFKLVVSREANRLASDASARIFSSSQWEQLMPSFVLDASERPDGYSLELLSICRGIEPGLTQDHGHAWVRLIKPTGEVYSVGFYPDESTRVEPDDVPGLRMPGMLLSPDKYEKHHQKGWNLRSVRYSISDKKFDEIKVEIERMQSERLNGSLAFDLCEFNCVNFVMRIAQMCNIDMRGQTSLSKLADDLYLGSRLQRIRTQLSCLFPTCISSFLARSEGFIRSILFNSALGLFGGFSILSMQWNKSSSGQVSLSYISNLSPVFASYKDVFSKKIPFYHVREFRQWQAETNRQLLEETPHA